MSTKVVSIINMKGGVGKTTITFNLAHSLAKFKNKKVLVIDFDPQANCSEAFLTYDKYESHGKNNKKFISDIFTDIDRIISAVAEKESNGFSLDDMTMRAYKYSNGLIDLVLSQLELSNILERAGGTNLEERLKIILKNRKQKYDYVLIDCSPAYSILTTNALKASDYVLIPVRPDPFSSRGIPLLNKKINLHNKHASDEDKVKELGIIFSMVKDFIYVSSVKTEIMKAHGNVFQNSINYTEHYATGLLENKPIFDTRAPQKYKNDFVKFTEEFEEKISKLEGGN